MYQKKLEKDIRCPLEYGLSVFGGKWKSRIICVLAAKKTLTNSSRVASGSEARQMMDELEKADLRGTSGRRDANGVEVE